MEKIQLGTPDITAENIERIGELFPQVLTEVENAEGEIERAVDFDVLRDLLGDVAEDTRERYQFTWPGKRDAKAEARRPITKTMRPVVEDSVDWDTTQNLYIEGDNLDALKILKETYAGKVKLIYIDPPYNTGHDFVYDDDYSQSAGEYAEASGDYDEERGRLVSNLESNGCFHSDWCSMMYSRLLIAKEMLSNDGCIFISIDENEACNMQKLCNEVFGEVNYAATFLWTKTSTPPSLAYKCRKTVEYVFAYERKSNTLKYYGGELDGGDAPLLNAGNPIKTICFPPKSIQFYFIKDGSISSGGRDKVFIENSFVVQNGWNSNEVYLTGEFKWEQSTVDREVANGTFFIVKTEKFSIRFQRANLDNAYKTPTNKMEIELGSEQGVGTNESAVKELKWLDMYGFFSYPKPISLIEKIIRMVGEKDKEALILDFFSGSATTAHAVMNLNASDGGSRRFIMVQIPEQLKEKHISESFQLTNICEIGEERIRRAGAKIAAEIEESNKQLKLGEEPKPVPDIGFRVLRIESSNFNDVSATPGETRQEALFELADNVKEGRTDLDLLFEILPKFRIPYSAKIEERIIAGKQCFVVEDDGFGAIQLIACFDTQVGTDTIEAIAKMQPLYAVLRDASLVNDATYANFEELFKTYSPDTVRRVI